MKPHEQLEEELSKWTGDAQVVACSSGTAALHLALEALALPSHTMVIVPDFSMIACARAVTLAGFTPVIAGCGEDGLIDPEMVEAALYALRSDYDRAVIMPVHTYGRWCEMPALSDLAQKFDCYMVEDCAEAHGVYRHIGSDAACWSFYRNKIVAGEEGGAVAFSRGEQADSARRLRSLGDTPDHDFWHTPRGHNYRMSDAHAKIILNSLGQQRELLEIRRRLEHWCNLLCPPEWKRPSRIAPWVYDLRIPDLDWNKQLDLVKMLNNNGIEARCGFKPLHMQPEYRNSNGGVYLNHAKSVTLSSEIFYLPLQPVTVTHTYIERAFSLIRTYWSKNGI